VDSYTTIDGFSLLNRISVTSNGFFFISLRPWSERKQTAQEILKSVNGRLASEVPEAIAFAFSPPAIPGLGNAGGFSFWLQDRSGGSVELLDQNLLKFLAAARQRPELAGVFSQFFADTPQLYADVDRDKVLKQGVAVGDVYQTLQAYLGGLYLNQFNRFGRQWRVFLQAEGEERLSDRDIEQYYVRNNDGQMVSLSSLVTTRRISGPEYTNRVNVYRAAQVIGAAAPGYSSGQARKRECDRGSSIRALESRTISDRVEALRKYGWRNTWLPGRIGINAPPARRPTRELLIRVLTHRQ
jgi:HAE1 family hydrophobic/amphiphilic exporter-1